MLKRCWSICLLFCLIPSAWALELKSNEIKNGQSLKLEQVFNGIGCEGGNQSPSLSWSDIPKDTQSFAITAYDPDAPTGSGWWHWVVFNIPSKTKSLPAGAGDPNAHLMPKGAIQSRTDFGKPGYGGACPPVKHGVHRYQFTIYALDIESLPLDSNASAAMVGFMVGKHKLASATIEALYERN